MTRRQITGVVLLGSVALAVLSLHAGWKEGGASRPDVDISEQPTHVSAGYDHPIASMETAMPALTFSAVMWEEKGSPRALLGLKGGPGRWCGVGDRVIEGYRVHEIATDRVTLVSDARAYYEIALGEGTEPEPSEDEPLSDDVGTDLPEEAIDLGEGQYVVYGPDVSGATNDEAESPQGREPDPDQIVEYGPVVTEDVAAEAERYFAVTPDPDQKAVYGPDASGNTPETSDAL